MKKRIFPLTDSRGFTMIEMVVVVVIMVLVSCMMATGIPAAVRSMNKAVEASHAQVLLSTAMTALRDELSTAKDIKGVSGTSVEEKPDAFKNAESITFTDGDSIPTAFKFVKNKTSVTPATNPGSDDGDAPSDNISSKPGATLIKTLPSGDNYTRLLVSAKAATSDLYVAYDSISYEDGIVTISGLEVRKPIKGSTEGESTEDSAENEKDPYTVLVRIDSYQIRVVGAGITSNRKGGGL